MRLRIKNWKTFQHYDHRCPPWIKLHFKLLSSRDWVSASDRERVLAIACMLVASQDEAKDGSFDGDPEYIKRVAYLHETPDFKPLINRGFLEMLADASGCLQKIPNGVTETEKSRDREEKETRFALPDWVPKEPWDEFVKMRSKNRRSMTDRAKQMAVNELKRLQLQGNEPKAVLEQSIFNSWQGLFEIKGNGHHSPASVGMDRGGIWTQEEYDAARKAHA